MYTADTSTLKNKGVDVLITNDSDVPITEDEQDGMDKSLNRRLRGARKSGGVATSTARLRVQNIGRTTKELALWDGYKIKVRDICNALQIDSSLFNDPDNKKYANVQEANKALYNDCVIPFTKLITENKELKADLGYDIYLDLSNIDCLQEAQNTRAEKAKTITEAIVGLNAQVKTSNISVEIAIKILVSEWEFDPQEAAQFIMVPETQPDPEPEKT
jgi:phage portal protein BeeE